MDQLKSVCGCVAVLADCYWAVFLGTRIYPEIQPKYSCDFEKASACTQKFNRVKYWKLKEDYDLILDSRWEGKISL